MLSASRSHGPFSRSIARTILAAALLLVVLAGVVPYSAIASRHECAMACCLGKPSHLAGSCATAFGEEEQAEAAEEEEAPPAEEDEARAAAHMNHMAHASVATDASVVTDVSVAADATSEAVPANAAASHATVRHHETAKPAAARHSTSGKKSGRRVTASAFQAISVTTACSTECAAAAIGYSQVRRPRSPAALTVAARPRPTALRSIASHLYNSSTESVGRGGSVRPRGPPHFFSLTFSA